jgi:hypothetical protein
MTTNQWLLLAKSGWLYDQGFQAMVQQYKVQGQIGKEL